MATQLGGVPLYQPRQPGSVPNPLDALIQGFQQGNAIQQLPQQLENNQINQMLQQALLREKLLDLQDPNRAVTREIQASLAKTAATPYSGVTFDPNAASLGNIAQPRTVNIDPTTGVETQVTARLPDITPLGKSGFMFNEAIPLQAAQRKQDSAIALLQAKADASGNAVQYIPTADGGISYVPKAVKKNETPVATPLLAPDSTPIKAAPKGGEKKTAITGNEVKKTIQEAAQLGVDYHPELHGDLTDPTRFAVFQKQITDAGEAQGAVTNPKDKVLAVRSQQNFNREPVVTTKKNLEIFGKEANDAIEHIIAHPEEPAGARQIEAFDSFIKAFSAGKPTVAQYGQIQQYQSVENFLANATDRLTTGKRLTDEELRTYADAIITASESIDAAYQTKVQQYRDELGAYGIKPKAAEKIIKSEGGRTLPIPTKTMTPDQIKAQFLSGKISKEEARKQIEAIGGIK